MTTKSFYFLAEICHKNSSQLWSSNFPLVVFFNKTNPKEKDFPQLRCWWGSCGDNLQQHSGLFQEYNTQTLKPHSAVEYFSFQTTDLSRWDVRFGSALTSRRGSEGQTTSPLTCFWPPSSQQQSLTMKKNRCWLLTGQPAFSCCAMIWTEDLHSAPVLLRSLRAHETAAHQLYTSKCFTSCGIYWAVACRIS